MYYYCLWFPCITQFVVERGLKVCKTETLVNREGIPSFCTNEHKVFIRQLPVLPIYKSISHKYIYMCCKSAKQM